MEIETFQYMKINALSNCVFVGDDVQEHINVLDVWCITSLTPDLNVKFQGEGWRSTSVRMVSLFQVYDQ